MAEYKRNYQQNFSHDQTGHPVLRTCWPAWSKWCRALGPRAHRPENNGSSVLVMGVLGKSYCKWFLVLGKCPVMPYFFCIPFSYPSLPNLGMRRLGDFDGYRILRKTAFKPEFCIKPGFFATKSFLSYYTRVFTSIKPDIGFSKTGPTFLAVPARP